MSVEIYNLAGVCVGVVRAEEEKYSKSTKGDVAYTCKVARYGYRPIYAVGYRLVKRRGLAIKWQGIIQRILTSRDPMGYDEITAAGDATRFGDLYAGGGAGEQFFLHDNRLHKGPKVWNEYDGQNSDQYDTRASKTRLMCYFTSNTYAANDAGGWTYQLASGALIRRMVFSYQYTAPSANFTFYAVDTTTNTVIWSGVTATGTGTNVVVTSSTGWNNVTFMLQNTAGHSTAVSTTNAATGFRITKCNLYGNISGDETATGAVSLLLGDVQSQTASNGTTAGQISSDTSAVQTNTLDVMPLTTNKYNTIGDLLDTIAGRGWSDNRPAEYGLETLDVGVHRFYYRPANVGQVRYILSDADAAQVDIETSIQDSYNAAFGTYTDAGNTDQATATSYATQDNAAPVQRTLRIDVGANGINAATQAVAIAIANSGVQRSNGNIPLSQPVRDLLRGGLVDWSDVEPCYCIAMPEAQAAQIFGSGALDARDGYSVVYISAVEVDENNQSAALTVEDPLNDLARFLAQLKK